MIVPVVPHLPQPCPISSFSKNPPSYHIINAGRGKKVEVEGIGAGLGWAQLPVALTRPPSPTYKSQCPSPDTQIIMFVPTLLRAFFVLASATILFIQSIPPFRSRFLVYGKVATITTTTNTKDAKPITPRDPKGPVTTLLDHLATYTVPHSFFTHFYILALATLLLLGQQISTHGSLYILLRDLQTPEWAADTRRVIGGQSVHQVVLTWTCLVLQTVRRLYECLFVQKKSVAEGGRESWMWVVHYALGLVFYVSVGIAGWVEGTDAIDAFKFTPMSLYSLVGPPSAKSFIGVIFFIFGSGFQHDCHAYLASLEKYTLPVHPAFQRLVCPHYFAECLVYLGLAIMSAPRGGGPFNVTMLTALIFVGVNLGVTSMLNREWYIEKFGEKSMKERWNMIPLLF